MLTEILNNSDPALVTLILQAEGLKRDYLTACNCLRAEDHNHTEDECHLLAEAQAVIWETYHQIAYMIFNPGCAMHLAAKINKVRAAADMMNAADKVRFTGLAIAEWEASNQPEEIPEQFLLKKEH